MSFASKHNSAARKFNFEIPKDFEYKSLSDIYREYGELEGYKVNALYINTKSKFGDAPVIATDNEMVNAPQHMLEQVKAALQDKESIDQINAGKVGFKLYKYSNEYGEALGIEWLDL